jgi:hypothetical protein
MELKRNEVFHGCSVLQLEAIGREQGEASHTYTAVDEKNAGYFNI